MNVYPITKHEGKHPFEMTNQIHLKNKNKNAMCTFGVPVAALFEVLNGSKFLKLLGHPFCTSLFHGLLTEQQILLLSKLREMQC